MGAGFRRAALPRTVGPKVPLAEEADAVTGRRAGLDPGAQAGIERPLQRVADPVVVHHATAPGAQSGQQGAACRGTERTAGERVLEQRTAAYQLVYPRGRYRRSAMAEVGRRPLVGEQQQNVHDLRPLRTTPASKREFRLRSGTRSSKAVLPSRQVLFAHPVGLQDRLRAAGVNALEVIAGVVGDHDCAVGELGPVAVA